MTLLHRFVRFIFGPRMKAATPELWCRPATVLALRDPGRAPSCVAGWH